MGLKRHKRWCCYGFYPINSLRLFLNQDNPPAWWIDPRGRSKWICRIWYASRLQLSTEDKSGSVQWPKSVVQRVSNQHPRRQVMSSRQHVATCQGGAFTCKLCNSWHGDIALATLDNRWTKHYVEELSGFHPPRSAHDSHQERFNYDLINGHPDVNGLSVNK